MTGSFRVWGAALLAALFITRAEAANLNSYAGTASAGSADLLRPCRRPGRFHLAQRDADRRRLLQHFAHTPRRARAGSPQGALSNVAIRPIYTVGLEAGYFITPNIAVALSAGIPPLLHVKATNLTLTPFLGTNLLGSARFGPAMGLLQYHFTNFGAFQPYLGAGAAYVLMFSNISDGILTNFGVDQNWAFVLQAGADYMLTQNWGVYVDLKKLIYYNPPFQGNLLNLGVPVRTLGSLDPWVVGAGITFKY